MVVGVVFAAAVLSSLAPPPPAFALRTRRSRKVGPGPRRAEHQPRRLRLQVLVSPNKAAAPGLVRAADHPERPPVRGANVTLLFNHLEMEMPSRSTS